jgi:hypothetical protein
MATDRLSGITGSVAIKAPCVAATSSNITLSGLQVIDAPFSITVVEGDRILVRLQTNETQNGIYIASTGEWVRSADFNGAKDIVAGTYIRVNKGTHQGLWYINNNDPIIIGTSAITFTKIIDNSSPNLGDLIGNSDDITQGSTQLFLTSSERSKIAGLGTISTQNANSVTVTGGNATLAGGTFDDVFTTDLQAATSAGLNFKTNSGTTAFSYGGGGSTTLALQGNLTFGGTTLTDTTGADTKLVSGTAGTNGNVAMWNSDGDAVDGGVVAANILVDGDIGSVVQAYDADILKADTTDVLTVGYATTPYNAGTISSGTFTPNEANGQQQYYTNGGAHTLAPPTNNTVLTIQVSNNGSAGTITISSFTIVTGDALTTTNGDDFFLRIEKLNGFSQLHVTALQ